MKNECGSEAIKQTYVVNKGFTCKVMAVEGRGARPNIGGLAPSNSGATISGLAPSNSGATIGGLAPSIGGATIGGVRPSDGGIGDQKPGA